MPAHVADPRGHNPKPRQPAGMAGPTVITSKNQRTSRTGESWWLEAALQADRAAFYAKAVELFPGQQHTGPRLKIWADPA